MGGFARARLESMSAADLDAFEALIELPDQDMLSWITGETPVPPHVKNDLLQEFIKFRP